MTRKFLRGLNTISDETVLYNLMSVELAHYELFRSKVGNDRVEHHGRTQGGGGAGDPDPPPPENHKIMGFLSNTRKLQSHQASIKCGAIIDPPEKRHINGVLLTAR